MLIPALCLWTQKSSSRCFRFPRQSWDKLLSTPTSSGGSGPWSELLPGFWAVSPMSLWGQEVSFGKMQGSAPLFTPPNRSSFFFLSSDFHSLPASPSCLQWSPEEQNWEELCQFQLWTWAPFRHSEPPKIFKKFLLEYCWFIMLC